MIRLFRVFVPASTLGLLVFETVVVISVFIGSTYLFLDLDPTDYLLNDVGLVSVLLISLSVIGGIYLQDLYSQIRVKSRLLLAQQLLMVAGIVFLLQALISVFAPDLYMPFRVVLFGCITWIAVIFSGRLLFSTYIFPHLAAERLLLIGHSLMLENILSYLEQRPQLGIQVAGRISPPDASGSLSSLEEQIREFHSSRLIVDAPDSSLAGGLLELRFLGYSVQEASTTYTKISNREGLSGLNPARLLYSKEFEPTPRDLFFQSIVNMLLATLCITVFLPLILFIAIAVRLFLGGPVLERRVRTGQGGVPFTMYSFRVTKAPDCSKPDHLVGRLLARTGLYAIPQLFNVLRGEMSIVGPRPLRPEFIQELTQHIPFYPHRLKILPGMTGQAQTSARTLADVPDCMVELEHDLYYLKYMSPAMDLFITFQSLKNILLWGGQP